MKNVYIVIELQTRGILGVYSDTAHFLKEDFYPNGEWVQDKGKSSWSYYADGEQLLTADSYEVM